MKTTKIYSHSRLGTFENCPLQYKYQYIDKIKRYEQGIEAFMGSMFHEAMEKLYGELKFKTLTLDELIAHFESLWEKNWSDNILIVRKDRKKEDYYELCKGCIRTYYKKYYPFNSSQLIGLEQYVKINLDGEGKYRLGGYIDRLSQREDGTYEIHDYKTSGTLPTQEKADSDRQLALYQIGVQDLWNDVKKVDLIWHYVVFDKEIVSKRDSDNLKKIKTDTIALIDKIESTETFEPHKSFLCNWCSYQDLCPLIKHKKKLESLPENEYLNDDGVKLVDRYANLKEEIAEKKAEIEKVRDALFSYSEKEQLKVIRGSVKELKISESEKISIPPKKSEERKQLNKIIRSFKKWDEVSTLDTFVLEKILKSGSWNEDMLQMVKKLTETKNVKEIRMSVLKDN